jgi:hypothetical protein
VRTLRIVGNDVAQWAGQWRRLELPNSKKMAAQRRPSMGECGLFALPSRNVQDGAGYMIHTT